MMNKSSNNNNNNNDVLTMTQWSSRRIIEIWRCAIKNGFHLVVSGGPEANSFLLPVAQIVSIISNPCQASKLDTKHYGMCKFTAMTTMSNISWLEEYVPCQSKTVNKEKEKEKN